MYVLNVSSHFIIFYSLLHTFKTLDLLKDSCIPITDSSFTPPPPFFLPFHFLLPVVLVVHQGADRCALRTRRWTLKTRLTPKSARWATPRTPPAAAMSWWGDTHTHTHMNTHTHTPSCTTFEFELNFWVEYCFFVYNVKQWNCVQSTNKKEEKKILQTNFHNIYSHNKNETTL